MDHKQQSDLRSSESSELSRRQFLSTSALASGAAFSAPAWLPRMAFGAGTGSSRDVLVHLFLRGAMDGLSFVPPYGDGHYYAARPSLGIAPPGQQNGAIDLDGFFGLNPNAQGLMTPYTNGDLAFVPASGLPDPTRSHFDGQLLVERGISDVPPNSAIGGWLGRHLARTPLLGPTRGIALTKVLPVLMTGTSGTVPTNDPSNFAFPGRDMTRRARQALIRADYATHPLLADSAVSSFEVVEALEAVDFENYTSAGALPYPDTLFGRRIRSTAALIDADIGIQAFAMDVGEWDDHAALGPIHGRFADRVELLSEALEAFYLDLLARGYNDSVTTVGVSEFGRRVEQNVSNGTDHGHGNVMFAMGGHINGGQVFGTWPGLAPANLDMGDVAVTTDMRDVLGEIALNRLQTPDLANVFPNHTVSPIGITV